jgi:predicted PurR-regulated permease PerM
MSELSIRAKRGLFLGGSAALAALALYVSRAVLLPFVLALVIAYVLTPLVAWFERKKMSRAAAIVLVYVLVLGSGAAFVRGILPRVAFELGNLRREAPTLSHTVQKQWVPAVQERLRSAGLVPPAEAIAPKEERENAAFVLRPRPDGSFAVEVGSGVLVQPVKGGFVVEPAREDKAESFDPGRLVGDAASKTFSYAEHNAVEIFRIGRDIVAAVSRVFFVFGVTLMLAAYIMLTRERIIAFFESLVRPSQREGFARLLSRMDRGLSGVVRGQLIICLVNGVLSAIGFALVGLKYWPVLALIATVLSLIPIFGSIISTVPAVAMGLTQSVGTGVFVLVWIIGIHQLEANFLNPKIMGDQARFTRCWWCFRCWWASTSSTRWVRSSRSRACPSCRAFFCTCGPASTRKTRILQRVPKIRCCPRAAEMRV